MPPNVGVGKITITGCGGVIPDVTYSLTINRLPAAGGTVSRSPDKPAYAVGEIVTLTAVPATGYNFINWTGGATGIQLSTTITMNSNLRRSSCVNDFILEEPRSSTVLGGTRPRDKRLRPRTGVC